MLIFIGKLKQIFNNLNPFFKIELLNINFYAYIQMDFNPSSRITQVLTIKNLRINEKYKSSYELVRGKIWNHFI